jgi:hypothetical protein
MGRSYSGIQMGSIHLDHEAGVGMTEFDGNHRVAIWPKPAMASTRSRDQDRTIGERTRMDLTRTPEVVEPHASE